MRELVVFREVRGAANDAAGHRPFVDAELEHHPDVQAGKDEQHSGNNEDMKCEESRQRCAGDDWAAHHEMDRGPPMNGTRLAIDAPMPRPQ